MRLLLCGQVIRPSYRWLLRYRPTVLLQEARALIDPAGFARLVARMDATGRAAVVLAPRLPQAVRHRRPAQRAAATHRGEDPRPSCWNDDGIRRHLSRGRHRASPRVHRPPPQPAPPPRSTAPSLPRSGASSCTTSSCARSLSAYAPATSAPLCARAQLHTIHSYGPTPTSGRVWSKSATTSKTGIAEAQREGWLGEIAGLEATLAAAEQKLHTMDQLSTRHGPTKLGMPDVRSATGRET